MADEADKSDERIQMAIESGVNAAHDAKPEAPHSGYCLTCGPKKPLPVNQRWCDADCRDDWQKEQDRIKRLATLN